MNAMQTKMARVALGISVREAANLADVSHDTITRIEAGAELKASTVQKVRTALESAGVIFVPGNGEGPGVRMRKFRPGDIVRARQAGSVSGITVEKGQTGIVTMVETETENLGTKYRVTVRFDENIPRPLSANDIELVKPASNQE